MDKKVHINTDHHVHFDTSVPPTEKNNEIVVKKISDDVISIQLGFLRLNHKYHVSIPVSRDLLNIDKDSKLISLNNENNLPHCSNNIMLASGDFVDTTTEIVNFELDCHTHKEKLVDEVLKFKVCGCDRVISLSFKARVLGIGKGTPLLKNGIHCTGVLEVDDDSENSDFPAQE